MEPRFLKLNCNQLLEEKNFTSWVLTGKYQNEWSKFIHSNPEFQIEADKARKIIHLLHDEVDNIDDHSIHLIWKNIEQYDAQQKKKIRRFGFIRRLGTAAVILLVISSGVFIYLTERDIENYRFVSNGENRNGEAHMLLSSGEEIALRKASSSIALDVTNDQVIVNDSVIKLNSDNQSGKKEVKMNEVVIPYGKKSELLLADGSKVWLNAGSRLAFPSSFAKDTREVFLEGEACFEVVTNVSQPFVVKTQNLAVKALGTLFNVSAYDSEGIIETVLLDGTVTVSKTKTFGLARDEVVMKPDQRISYNKSDKSMEILELQNASSQIAWTRGWLEYQKESLVSVLHKVERYFNVEINLPPDYPADDIITGKLDLEGSLEEVMRSLADATGFQYRIKNNIVAIVRKIEKLPAR